MSEADVALILEDRLDSSVSRDRIPQIASTFMELCERHQLEPDFILALIEVESRFRTKAISPMGAVGLMQILPTTARVVARQSIQKEHLFNPELNLKLGMEYLGMLREKYQGKSPYFPIAAYNIGPARLDYLMNRPQGFKPRETKIYYDRIIASIPALRRWLEKKKSSTKLAQIQVGGS
jgi:soluble lytic murein transglycosylase